MWPTQLHESCSGIAQLQAELEMYTKCQRYNLALSKKISESTKESGLKHKQLIRRMGRHVKKRVKKEMGGFLAKMCGNAEKSNTKYSFQEDCPVCKRWKEEFKAFDFEKIHEYHLREQKVLLKQESKERREAMRIYGKKQIRDMEEVADTVFYTA